MGNAHPNVTNRGNRAVNQEQKHPIFAGLIALVAVAVSVGLILGVVVLVGTRILGIGADDTHNSADHGASLYLPSPSPTKTATGPDVTLSSQPSQSASSKPSPATSKKPERKITLQSSTPDVSPMQTFTISGVYPDGEGSLMRLQRKVDGAWQDFGIPDVAVTDGQFSTTVQTGRSGVQKFRMKDMDHNVLSNVVDVTVG